MRQTTFGGRYVTAEDVARCTEAFDACIHGGASSGGGSPKPPVSTPSAGGGGARKTMPQRFRLDGEDFDCTVRGDAVDCTAPATDTTTKAINATLSGLTMTGTRTEHFVGPSVQGCVSTVDYSWPITYVFRADGTGDLHMSQGHYDQTLSGSCSGEFSEPVDGADGPIKWSPIQ